MKIGTKYDRMINDDLKKLLTERELPTTGKKADFVARLVEYDEKSAESTKEVTEPQAEKAATTTTQSTIPSKQVDAPTEAAPVTTTPQTTNTPQVSNDEREAKLAARAARFGLSKDEEAMKKEARAARFGSTQTAGPHPEDQVLSAPKARKATTDKQTATKETKVPAASKPQDKRKVSVLDDPIEAEKARKRALKFGIAQVTAPALSDPTKPPAAEVAK